MSTRPKQTEHHAEDTHVGKDFAEVAERVFADNTPPQSLYAPVLDEDESEQAA